MSIEIEETKKGFTLKLAKKYERLNPRSIFEEAIGNAYRANIAYMNSFVPIDTGTLRRRIVTDHKPKPLQYTLGTDYRGTKSIRGRTPKPLIEELNYSRYKRYAKVQYTTAGRKRPSHNPKRLQGQPLWKFWDKGVAIWRKQTIGAITKAINKLEAKL